MATLSLNPVKEPTLKAHVKARAATMLASLEDQKQDWSEIARYSGHPVVQALLTTRNGTRRPKSRPIYDGHATRAFRYLESGLYSGNSSPNRPWFGFTLKNRRGEKPSQTTKIWMGECVSILAMMLAGSNFYRVVRSNYGELGKFGTAAGIMDEDWENGIVCTALTIGEYAIDTNKAGEVDTLLRVVGMSTVQIVDAFVRQRDGTMEWSNVDQSVRAAWDNSSYATVFTVHHLIEPNKNYREGGWSAEGMRWRSVKWMTCDERPNTLLENKGYYEKPFWAPRWKIYGTDIWGTGPGHDVLPDMRELQQQSKRKGEVTDLVVKPPTQGPKDFVMRPGTHLAIANVDAGGKVEVVYEAPYQAINLVGQDVLECRRAISEGTYADLFMAISDRDGVQPLNDMETQLRNDEKMTQLGPVIESINTDMLATAIERLFGIASRGGLLPDPPEELEGQELDIEFISVLAQAQKMMGAGQTERSLAFVSAVAGFQQDVIDLVDGDALVKDHWDRSAAPAIGIRDQATVDQIRAQRMQQQQMQQMAALAAPAKQAVDAATLLNEMGQQ